MCFSVTRNCHVRPLCNSIPLPTWLPIEPHPTLPTLCFSSLHPPSYDSLPPSLLFLSSLSLTSLLCYPIPPSPTQKDKDKDKHDKQDKSHATPTGTPQTGPPQAPQAGANPTSTPTPASSSSSAPLTLQQSPPQSSTPSNTPAGAVPPGGAAPGPLPVNGPPKHAGVTAVHPQHLVGPPLSLSLSQLLLFFLCTFCCVSFSGIVVPVECLCARVFVRRL